MAQVPAGPEAVQDFVPPPGRECRPQALGGRIAAGRVNSNRPDLRCGTRCGRRGRELRARLGPAKRYPKLL